MAHRYWRLYFPNAPRGGPGYDGSYGVCCTGVEMRASQGGANEIGSGTASASSSQSGTSPANGFAAYSGTSRWQSDAVVGVGAAPSYPHWLKYDFGSGNDVEIEEITMTGVAGGNGSTNPVRIVLQHSDDNVDWTDKYFWQTASAWLTDGSDTRVFNSTNAVDYTFAPQMSVVSFVNYPAEEVRATHLSLMSFFPRTSQQLRATKLSVVSWVRGRVASPFLRTWTFQLDQHRFYGIDLGVLEKTLVYDMYPQRWMVWGTGDSDWWRGRSVRNWLGGRGIAPNQSAIVVGDDTNGSLYWLSPDEDIDDGPLEESDPAPFEREITGQVVVKPGYGAAPCFGVQLFGSIGQWGESGTVSLQISDDRGQTWWNAGDVTLPAGEIDARVHWRSLGSMRAPGRLFRISDYGALKRIDDLQMDDPR